MNEVAYLEFWNQPHNDTGREAMGFTTALQTVRHTALTLARSVPNILKELAN